MTGRGAMRGFALALAAAACLGAGPALAAPPAPGEEGKRLAGAYLLRKAVTDPPAGLSEADAFDAQRAFVRVIAPSFGGPVGYKAALTSSAAQARFGVKEPVAGVLLGHMFLRNGGTLPAAFGARPLVEPDLVVRVASFAINRARTEMEVLKALDGVYPFLELPDLVYAAGTRPDAGALVAIDAGARHGVLGERIPFAPGDDPDAWYERLRDFRAVLLDPDGRIVGAGHGRALLGHPLAAVVWLRDALRARKVMLSPGDLLSLGTVVPPLPAAPGAWRVRYTGLDPAGPVEVGITLTE